MFTRNAQLHLEQSLKHNPAVVILGPRQVGKTTLAHTFSANIDATYIDLEDPSDLAKLDDPGFYLQQQQGKLVIIDEVQRKPELFPVLRSQIDKNRQMGFRSGQFLLLGSASNQLLYQSSESLAGRVSYQELFPLNLTEVGTPYLHDLWVKGGFPDAFLAGEHHPEWCQNFIKTYLERDIPMLGSRIPAETLRRFWTMLAHNQGQLFNASRLGAGLGVSGQATARYLDLMVDLMLVRRLPPWFANVKKRLVKSPKIYVRDSGILHTLLHVQNLDDLLGNPIVGASWEGFVLENILSHTDHSITPYFYRTSSGAEIDLLLDFGSEQWAIEIKRSTAPKLSKGFYLACDDLKPSRKFLVYPGDETYTSSPDITVLPLAEILKAVAHSV